MGHASKKIFSHTHYGISTVAAVLYAIAWLLGNQVRADVRTPSTVLPAVVVTAQRMVESVATLDAVTVTAKRESAVERFVTLEPVYVFASRDSATGDAYPQPAVLTASNIAMESAPRKKGFVSRVRAWMVNALLK